MKRRITDIKKRTKTIKKWGVSNKSIVDFKVKENQRSINDLENKIKEMSEKLHSRIKEIGNQKRDIETIIYNDGKTLDEK